ncbi:bifunctional PPPDE peptidase domain superfamily/PPPDE peptidase domain [Babesia duncani]|uniref:Bifunctional PPPDE peptidase domain superfamily/PPPDE peptidase domain n=1 Tax=Babesia duncani TaxID=323732 RepID=A0AAD9UQQ9_9APIC|nr:bifunctional PPPDE peptidase domain superfamily/PPPDE peptidase domain [Babesia duncani]
MTQAEKFYFGNGSNVKPLMQVADGVPAEAPKGTFPVYLKAYDLSHGLVSQISMPILGFQLEAVWHTGIAVYGNEYMFGDGIYSAKEEDCERLVNHPLLRKILLGYTSVTEENFKKHLEELSEAFSIDTYDLTSWNCNNFSNVISEFLLGTEIPCEFINFVDKIKNTQNGAYILDIIKAGRMQDKNSFVVPGQF